MSAADLFSMNSRWFVETSMEFDSSATRVLVFSHISEHRDATAVLQSLVLALKSHKAHFSHVIFTTFDESENRRASMQAGDPTMFQDTWKRVFPDTRIHNESTIMSAIELVKKLSSGGSTQVLITGSQHLIGPALRILRSEM